jgi:hypothetical protein
MEIFYARCCGLDVHKSTITAGVRLHDDGGKPRKMAIRRDDKRLARHGKLAHRISVTHVAMESTGCTGSQSGTFWRGSSR